jgi:hypothetical protein
MYGCMPVRCATLCVPHIRFALVSCVPDTAYTPHGRVPPAYNSARPPITLLLSIHLEYVSSYGTRGCHSFRCPLKKAWAPGIPLARLLSLCLQYRHSAWVWSHGTEACMFVCAARGVEFTEWVLVMLFRVMNGYSSCAQFGVRGPHAAVKGAWQTSAVSYMHEGKCRSARLGFIHSFMHVRPQISTV